MQNAKGVTVRRVNRNGILIFFLGVFFLDFFVAPCANAVALSEKAMKAYQGILAGAERDTDTGPWFFRSCSLEEKQAVLEALAIKFVDKKSLIASSYRSAILKSFSYVKREDLVPSAKGGRLLLQVFKNETDPATRRSLLEALSFYQLPESVSDIESIPFQSGQAKEMKEAAIKALGGSNNAKAIAPLTRFINDPNQSSYLRKAAAFALANLDTPAVVAPMVAAMKSSDAWLRAGAIDSIPKLAPQWRTLVPALIEGMKGESADTVGSVVGKLDALQGKIPLKEKKECFDQLAKGLDTFVTGLSQTLTTAPGNSDEYLAAVKKFSDLRDSLPKRLRPQLYRALAKATKPPPRPDIDPCTAVCHLADHFASWMKPDALSKSDHFNVPGHPQVGWGTALASLHALFVAKAAPYCDSADTLSRQITSDWLKTGPIPEPPAPDPKDAKAVEEHKKALQALRESSELINPKNFSDAETFMKRVGYEGDKPKDSAAIFSKQFQVILMRDILNNRTLTSSEREEAKRALKVMDDLLNHEMEKTGVKPTSMEGGYGGSLMKNYHLSSSAIAALKPAPDSLELLDSLAAKLKPGEEYECPYDLTRNFVAVHDSTEAAPRCVTFYYALYQRYPAKYRKLLIGSLKNLVREEVTANVRMHMKRNDTHLGTAGDAPYYYWPNAPYASAALTQLLAEAKARGNDGEEKEFKGLRKALTHQVSGLMLANGLALAPGEKHYPSGAVWANPFAGLALLPLIDSCPKKGPVPPSWGIVDPQLAEIRVRLNTFAEASPARNQEGAMPSHDQDAMTTH